LAVPQAHFNLGLIDITLTTQPPQPSKKRERRKKRKKRKKRTQVARHQPLAEEAA
jgi:hypothetical protein